jgi:hypothetical protein
MATPSLPRMLFPALVEARHALPDATIPGYPTRCRGRGGEPDVVNHGYFPWPGHLITGGRQIFLMHDQPRVRFMALHLNYVRPPTSRKPRRRLGERVIVRWCRRQILGPLSGTLDYEGST